MAHQQMPHADTHSCTHHLLPFHGLVWGQLSSGRHVTWMSRYCRRCCWDSSSSALLMAKSHASCVLVLSCGAKLSSVPLLKLPAPTSDVLVWYAESPYMWHCRTGAAIISLNLRGHRGGEYAIINCTVDRKREPLKWSWWKPISLKRSRSS